MTAFSSLRPYIELARLHKPVGIWLLFFPSLWSLCVAAPDLKTLVLLAGVFLGGSIIMRGAGCTYNDMVDCPLDRHVARTKDRPLPREAVSGKAAFLFLLAQLFSAAFLLFLLPAPTILLGMAALGWVFLYPWMKRWTYWPQLFLGIAFGWGILMAWTAAGKPLSLVPFLLYGVVVGWVIGYDTLYAHQDVADDLLLGIKSTAILSRKRPRLFMGGVYGGTLLGFCLLGGVVSWAHPGWYWAGVVWVAGHFFWQVYQADFLNSSLCGRLFRGNVQVGWVMAGAFFLAQFP